MTTMIEVKSETPRLWLTEKPMRRKNTTERQDTERYVVAVVSEVGSVYFFGSFCFSSIAQGIALEGEEGGYVT